MTREDYYYAVGILNILKYLLKPKYHEVIDEVIDTLVTDYHEEFGDAS